MSGYYADRLSARRLERCYQIAPPRVRRYLAAEIEYVVRRVGPEDRVLELGCGYGRVLAPLAEAARWVVGVDTSVASLRLGRRRSAGAARPALAAMDAVRLGFKDCAFDCVVCVQNGISAFHVEPTALVREAVRVTRRGGKFLFSTYSSRFWDARLDWFRRQARAGLVGEIDEARTADGVIVCKDGFRATTVSPEEFLALTEGLEVERRIEEVDGSSLFCELTRLERGG